MAISRNDGSEAQSELNQDRISIHNEKPIKQPPIISTPTLTSEQAAIIRRLSQPTLMLPVTPGNILFLLIINFVY